MVSALALTLLLGLAPAATGDGPHDAEGTHTAYAFAESLLAEGDYYRAIGEYKRYLFLAPDGGEADSARMAIGLAYLRGGQADAAAAHYAQVAKLVGGPLQADALLQVGYAYYVGGNYGRAYGYLADWLARTARDAREPSVHRAHYLLAWTELSLGADPEAAEHLTRAAPFPGDAPLAAAVAELSRLPSRSPWIAGALSIVPGLGHVYAGQPLVGLTALLWNGLFGYAIYDSLRQGQLGVAIIAGVLELLWYSGSIFGAVQAALKFNRDVRTNALEELRGQYDDRPESWPPAAVRPARSEGPSPGASMALPRNGLPVRPEPVEGPECEACGSRMAAHGGNWRFDRLSASGLANGVGTSI